MPQQKHKQKQQKKTSITSTQREQQQIKKHLEYNFKALGFVNKQINKELTK